MLGLGRTRKGLRQSQPGSSNVNISRQAQEHLKIRSLLLFLHISGLTCGFDNTIAWRCSELHLQQKVRGFPCKRLVILPSTGRSRGIYLGVGRVHCAGLVCFVQIAVEITKKEVQVQSQECEKVGEYRRYKVR